MGFSSSQLGLDRARSLSLSLSLLTRVWRDMDDLELLRTFGEISFRLSRIRKSPSICLLAMHPSLVYHWECLLSVFEVPLGSLSHSFVVSWPWYCLGNRFLFESPLRRNSGSRLSSSPSCRPRSSGASVWFSFASASGFGRVSVCFVFVIGCIGLR